MKKQKRINVALRDDVHTKAKVIAVLKDITLNEFIQRAIEDAIDKDKKILEKIREIR